MAVALSRLATDPRSMVAAAAGTQFGSRARQAVPADSKVTVDEGSWAPDGAGGGVITVTVTPPGQGPRSYAAVMVNEAGTWKVLATVPLGIPAGGTPG